MCCRFVIGPIHGLSYPMLEEVARYLWGDPMKILGPDNRYNRSLFWEKPERQLHLHGLPAGRPRLGHVQIFADIDKWRQDGHHDVDPKARLLAAKYAAGFCEELLRRGENATLHQYSRCANSFAGLIVLSDGKTAPDFSRACHPSSGSSGRENQGKEDERH